MHNKYTIKELWDIILEQPLVEAEKRHKEQLKVKKESKNASKKS